jgi:chromosomal replication initiation ATPase DnaA
MLPPYCTTPKILRDPAAGMIIQQCAEVFGITVEALLSASRKIQPLFARHACAYLLKTQYSFSTTQIAACINRRQRGTVLNALRQAQDLLATNRYFRKNYDEVCKCIGIGRSK